MKEKIVFIDCDGVILDSEQRMLRKKEERGFLNHHDGKEFDDYFALADMLDGEWEYIICGAKSINNSVEIIRELEMMKKNIAILTKIHSLKEMKIKAYDLRENRNIFSPIIFVPPDVQKHNIILPNEQLLIDDSEKNITGWINNGGNGLLFDLNREKIINCLIKNHDYKENSKVSFKKRRLKK